MNISKKFSSFIFWVGAGITLVVITLVVGKRFYAIEVHKQSNEIIVANSQAIAQNKVGKNNWLEQLQDGDIIFQTSLSAQSAAVQMATHSKWSHCGLVFKNKVTERVEVLEAVEPVKYTPIVEWITRGKASAFEVKRLADNSLLSDSIKLVLRAKAEQYLGKSYDLTFEWTDEKIYCSELIWKAYHEATGLSVGKLQKLSDFDLSSDDVREIMVKRYGRDIPLNEIVIAPDAVYSSGLLKMVVQFDSNSKSN
jgi:uncharacterized protein YycO